MAANLKKIISAGFERLYYGPTDSLGYLLGALAAAPTAGDSAGSGMGRLDGVRTADLAIQEPEAVSQGGDDGVLGIEIFEPDQLPAFTIETGSDDQEFAALCQSTKVHDIGDISIGVLQPNEPNYIDMCLLGVQRAKSRAAGSTGVRHWRGVLIPRATIIPLGPSGLNARQFSNYRYRVTANIADRYPWGLSLSDTNNGTTGAPILPMTAEHRLHLHRFTGDGTADDFVLAYTPASAAKVHVYVDGVLKTLTTDYTVDTATKTVTFAAGKIPAAAAKIVIFYEHLV